MVPNDTMIIERIGKDQEGSGHSIISYAILLVTGRTETIHRKPFRIAASLSDVRTRDFPNMKRGYCPLRRNVRSHGFFTCVPDGDEWSVLL
jgi:hypothetical protein